MDIPGWILLGRRNKKCLVCAKDNEGTSTAVVERMKRQVTRDSIREKSGMILH